MLVKKNAVVLGKVDCSPDTEIVKLCSALFGATLGDLVRAWQLVLETQRLFHQETLLTTFRSFLGTIPDGPLSRKVIYL